MRKIIILALLAFVFMSCGSASKISKSKAPSKADRIVNQAQSYSGTKYKYGGTTSRGMDCSGLIYVAFQKENIVLPRVSRDMATRGKKVSETAVKKGDLLFFKTNKSSRKINHVGLVTAVKKGLIYFMHSTTSKGVITSSLDERYWRRAFAHARRVL